MTAKKSLTSQTFGDWAQVAIAKHTAKVLKHEVEVLRDRDPEQLHQMRIGMRRLRSAIVGFAPALDFPESINDQKIGKVAKVLGQLRDLDVLQDRIQQEAQFQLPAKEQQTLQQVIKKLKKQRKQALKRVQETLTDQPYQYLKKELQGWLAQPNYQMIAALPMREVLSALLLPQISQLLLHPGWLVGVKFKAGKMKLSQNISPKKLDRLLEVQGKLLHSLRKEAKRTRYQMELFTPFYSERYKYYLKQVKQIQVVLGQMQDDCVIFDFLHQSCGLDSEKKLPILVQKLRDNSYQQWQKWTLLQDIFLDCATREDLNLSLIIDTNNKNKDEKQQKILT